MKRARSYTLALPLPLSRVLIFGGMGGDVVARSAELFEYSRMR
jgi:hypothetical protein